MMLLGIGIDTVQVRIGRYDAFEKQLPSVELACKPFLPLIKTGVAMWARDGAIKTRV